MGVNVLTLRHNGTVNLRIQNNTVGKPTSDNSGIRLSNGSTADPTFAPVMCAQVTNNTTTPADPDPSFGDVPPGITFLQRNGMGAGSALNFVGLANGSNGTQAEDYVAGLNPGSSLGVPGPDPSPYYLPKRAQDVSPLPATHSGCSLPAMP
jgi:hypothetical protein